MYYVVYTKLFNLIEETKKYKEIENIFDLNLNLQLNLSATTC